MPKRPDPIEDAKFSKFLKEQERKAFQEWEQKKEKVRANTDKLRLTLKNKRDSI